MKLLTPAERRQLKARAHALHPVVSIGTQGLSEAVLAEIDRSLKAHELIKVRTHGIERDQREVLLAQMAERLDAAAVQHIGNILVLYRPEPEPTQEPARRRGVSAARRPTKDGAAPSPRRRRVPGAQR
jgi:putative YhbY family RNA-binding protein